MIVETPDDSREAVVQASGAETEVSAVEPRWSLLERIGFRFAFAWFFFDCIGYVVGLVETTTGINLTRPLRLYRGTVTSDRVGEWVWGLEPRPYQSTAQVVVHFTGALLLVTLIVLAWSLLDRRRQHYRTLHGGLRVFIRYALGVWMLSYSMAKVIPTQFPGVHPVDLVRPFGQFDRMAMLWSFMSLSVPYQMFAGLVETLGALLLFFRRTTTLGALVIIAALGQVIALDLAFDVPAKMNASMMFLFAVILVIPDLRRLMNFLVLGRSARLGTVQGPRVPGWLARIRWPLKAALVAGAVFAFGRDSFERWVDLADRRRLAIQGIYDVQILEQRGTRVPLLLGDTMVWRRIIVPNRDAFVVQLGDDRFVYYRMEADPAARTLALIQRSDTTVRYTVAYDLTEISGLRLRMTRGSDSLDIRLRKVRLDTLPVYRRNTGW